MDYHSFGRLVEKWMNSSLLSSKDERLPIELLVRMSDLQVDRQSRRLLLIEALDRHLGVTDGGPSSDDRILDQKLELRTTFQHEKGGLIAKCSQMVSPFGPCVFAISRVAPADHQALATDLLKIIESYHGDDEYLLVMLVVAWSSQLGHVVLGRLASISDINFTSFLSLVLKWTTVKYQVQDCVILQEAKFIIRNLCPSLSLHFCRPDSLAEFCLRSQYLTRSVEDGCYRISSVVTKDKRQAAAWEPSGTVWLCSLEYSLANIDQLRGHLMSGNSLIVPAYFLDRLDQIKAKSFEARELSRLFVEFLDVEGRVHVQRMHETTSNGQIQLSKGDDRSFMECLLYFGNKLDSMKKKFRFFHHDVHKYRLPSLKKWSRVS